MRIRWVSCWVGFGLGALLLGGCGGHSDSPHTVTVQLDVTSSNASVSWSGSVSGDNSVNVQGTTPSSQQVRVRVTPATLTAFSAGPSTTISASIGAFAPGPGNTVTVPPVTVCLKDLQNGARACHTGTGPGTVSVSS